jgi:hypothetical protein
MISKHDVDFYREHGDVVVKNDVDDVTISRMRQTIGEILFCGAMDPNAVGLEYAKAVPLLAPAGSMSFHHVRVVHGSSQNTSSRSRNLLLNEFATADAWPLAGVSDCDAFNARLVAGTPTDAPRPRAESRIGRQHAGRRDKRRTRGLAEIRSRHLRLRRRPRRQ